MPGMPSAVARFLQLIRRSKRGAATVVESRRELSARYMRELSELVDDRQITSSDAEKVIRDLLDPSETGSTPRVRLAVWRSYVRERTGQVGLKLVGSGSADLDDDV